MKKPEPKAAEQPRPDFYEMLGVPRHASTEQIKLAYRQRAMNYHPDHTPKGTEIMRRFNEAYLILVHPERRAIYDRSLGIPVPIPSFVEGERVR